MNDSIISNSLAVKKTIITAINNDMFNEAINNIVTSKRVIFFGIGFSYFVCQQMIKYFQLYNINGHNILNIYDALQLIKTASDDLWIVISISLVTKEITFLLKELALFKIKTLLITSNVKSELLKNISYVFILKVAENIQKDEFFYLNFDVTLITLANLIILGIINKINDDKIKRFSDFNKQTKKWNNYNIKPFKKRKKTY